MRWRQALLIAVIAFAAAAIGVLAGRSVASSPKPAETELHALLYRELVLTDEQYRKLDAIEAGFAIRRPQAHHRSGRRAACTAGNGR